MKTADQVVLFKSWAPDRADLNNPGLVRAENAVPLDGVYKGFGTHTANSSVYPTQTIGATSGPLAAFIAKSSLGTNRVIVGVTNALLRSNGANWATMPASFTLNGNGSVWQFALYDDDLIAVNGGIPVSLPMSSIVGGTLGPLATSGTAPSATAIGVVNQFVVVGNINTTVGSAGHTTGAHSVQWSGIDAPHSWPTPASSTATAQQSGLQRLDATGGEVTHIFGNDQFSIILQRQAVTRMTYVGGSTVFQFDQLETRVGCPYPYGAVRVDNVVYFASYDGFHVTDGSTIRNIGEGFVNRYFRDSRYASMFDRDLFAAVDEVRKLILWAYPIDTDEAERILVYNYAEGRWGLVSQNVHVLFSGTFIGDGVYKPVGAFSHADVCGSFDGAPGTAIIETGEVEGVPGGFTFLQGVKPIVDTTLNAMTVAVGYRNDQGAAVTYTAETTANSRSGFADFRTSARYHRARVTITGTFNAAQGVEVQAVPDGAV